MTPRVVDLYFISLIIVVLALIGLIAITFLSTVIVNDYPKLDHPVILYIPWFFIIILYYLLAFKFYFNKRISKINKISLKRFTFIIDLIVIFIVGLLIFISLGTTFSLIDETSIIEFIITIILLPFVAFLHYNVQSIISEGDKMKLSSKKEIALKNIALKLNNINNELIKPYKEQVDIHNLNNTGISATHKINTMTDDELTQLSNDFDIIYNNLDESINKLISK